MMLRETTTVQPDYGIAHDDYAHYRARVSAAFWGHAKRVKGGDADGLVGGEWVYPLPASFASFASTVEGELRGRFKSSWWPVGAGWTPAGWENHYAVATSDDFDSAFDDAVSEHWEAVVDLFAADVERVGA